MPRARYHEAVEWIAVNDEPTLIANETVAELISVQLVADVWSKPTTEVARDVINKRRKLKNEEARL